MIFSDYGEEKTYSNPFDDPSSPLYTPADGSLPVSNDANAGSDTLQYGAKGALVKDLQEGLNYVGFSVGTVDGVFGAATLAAVKSFQKFSGLSQDGVVGKDTWSALRQAVSAKKALTTSKTSTGGTTGATKTTSTTLVMDPITITGNVPSQSKLPYVLGGVALLGLALSLGR